MTSMNPAAGGQNVNLAQTIVDDMYYLTEEDEDAYKKQFF